MPDGTASHTKGNASTLKKPQSPRRPEHDAGPLAHRWGHGRPRAGHTIQSTSQRPVCALAAHSSVFKSMLSLPQPPSESEVTVEDCPVLHVSDSAAEIAALLLAH